ncbi:MAG: hypothetical protein ACOY93_06880 [Bacillota bacterium]
MRKMLVALFVLVSMMAMASVAMAEVRTGGPGPFTVTTYTQTR